MSVSYFGKPVPVHFAMLSLAGWHVDVEASFLLKDDVTRLEEMERGRHDLVQRTEVDLGYDLASWRELLLTFDEFEYLHPYAFEIVDKAICSAIADPDFQRLRKLKESPSSDSGR